MQKHILIVEDEQTINRMIANYFKKEGYVVSQALDGEEALSIFNREAIDLVCLDIMMPKMNGWEVAYQLREQSMIPIIMMSALSEEDDILKSYALKVDDYITKPFNPRVLVAKVANMLERYELTQPLGETEIKRSNLRLNTKTKTVHLNQKKLSLTKKEYDLLKFFIENEGAICSRKLLCETIWGKDVEVDERIVDTYVKKLRQHLGPYSDYIKTIFGVGYRFETDS